jgi:hypothetical protein
MANNPLQQFFRQPKIYISLPSQGVYNKPSTFSGNIERLAIYGMTGMDEIMIKTPDALLSGESTARVIQSCCPEIADPWDLSLLDTDLLLTAIRIATFGNDFIVEKTCSKCATENEFSLDLSGLIDHYSTCKYDSKLVLKDLVIHTRPLTYKQSTEFSVKNFQLQQRMRQLVSIEDQEEQKQAVNSTIEDLAVLRNELFVANIESVSAGATMVTERSYISEWLNNVDRDVVNALKDHLENNKNRWTAPNHKVKCENCGYEDTVIIDLDQSNFFAQA